MPVYSRAGLSRTVTPVVALSLTAVSTGVAVCAFGAADTKSARTIDLDRSNGATIGSETLLSFEPWGLAGLAPYDSGANSISGNVRFEVATAAQRDPMAAQPVERIRKAE